MCFYPTLVYNYIIIYNKKKFNEIVKISNNLLLVKSLSLICFNITITQIKKAIFSSLYILFSTYSIILLVITNTSFLLMS